MSNRAFEISYDSGLVVVEYGKASVVAEKLGISTQRLYYYIHKYGGYIAAHKCRIRLVDVDTGARAIKAAPADRSQLNAVPNMVEIVLKQMAGDLTAPRRAWGCSSADIKPLEYNYRLAIEAALTME